MMWWGYCAVENGVVGIAVSIFDFSFVRLLLLYRGRLVDSKLILYGFRLVG